MLEFVLIGKRGGVVIKTVPGDPWQSWGAPRVSWVTLAMLRRKDQHREKHQERMPRGWGPRRGLLAAKSKEEGAQETSVGLCRERWAVSVPLSPASAGLVRAPGGHLLPCGPRG